jgi:hypothetical protein
MIFSYGGTAIGRLKTFLFFDKTKFNDRAFYGKSRCGIFIRQAAFLLVEIYTVNDCKNAFTSSGVFALALWRWAIFSPFRKMSKLGMPITWYFSASSGKLSRLISNQSYCEYSFTMSSINIFNLMQSGHHVV